MLALLCMLAPAASAGEADVTVTSTALDPPVLMKGDTGTLTVAVRNNGAETVTIGSARLYNDGVVATSDPYPTVGDIGAGVTKTFTFSIRADGGEGTFYPVFVVDFRDGGSLRYPVPVLVEDTPLSVSVVKKPDAFAEGRTVDLTLRVGNPRPNAASGVQVVPRGTDVTVAPTGGFIGTLPPDGSATLRFNLTPAAETNVTFQVIWRNGINTHTADLVLPITFGEDRQQADPVVTNIEVISAAGGSYRITGDVTNAGLRPARSVLVTTGAPAAPTDPFRVYVVGTLDPDDISSFEVTFRADTGTREVPVIVEYRDDDGNRYSTTTPVLLVNRTAENGDAAGVPAAAAVAVILLVAVAAAAVWYYRRRRQ